ncbi:MAG: hypothetical protein NTZ32_22045 [Planctomycetales bacterium]|nr:hypothetical protein [Planctomycetales bacterium]
MNVDGSASLVGLVDSGGEQVAVENPHQTSGNREQRSLAVTDALVVA